MESVRIADAYDLFFNPRYLFLFLDKLIRAIQRLFCCAAWSAVLTCFVAVCVVFFSVGYGIGWLYADTKIMLDEKGVDLHTLMHGSGWRSRNWHNWMHLHCRDYFVIPRCAHYFDYCFRDKDSSYCKWFYSSYPNWQTKYNFLKGPYKRAEKRFFGRLFNLKSARSPTPPDQIFDATGFSIDELKKIMTVYKWVDDGIKNPPFKFKERYPTGYEPVDPTAVTYEDYNEVEEINKKHAFTTPPPPPLIWPRHWSRPRK